VKQLAAAGRPFTVLARRAHPDSLLLKRLFQLRRCYRSTTGVRDMSDDNLYAISLDNRFAYLTVIDVPNLVAINTHKWSNQTLTQVDGSVVRLGIVQGEFHWHHHEDEDELFFVLDGELLIDFDDGGTVRTVTLQRHQGFNVPKRTRHRTRAPHRTVMLMMSAAGVAPTGD
jgi:mannose-6-phosphate isomerase-like protein (cupin superfamily)